MCTYVRTCCQLEMTSVDPDSVKSHAANLKALLSEIELDYAIRGDERSEKWRQDLKKSLMQACKAAQQKTLGFFPRMSSRHLLVLALRELLDQLTAQEEEMRGRGGRTDDGEPYDPQHWRVKVQDILADTYEALGELRFRRPCKRKRGSEEEGAEAEAEAEANRSPGRSSRGSPSPLPLSP